MSPIDSEPSTISPASAPLRLHVQQTSMDTWHLPGEVTLSGHVDNVFEAEAAHVRVQVAGREPLDAQLSILEEEETGRTRLGWSVQFWLDETDADSFAAIVLANVRRQSVAVRRTFAVARAAAAPVGELSTPAPDATMTGDVLIVRGWCLFPDSRTARVAVFVNGELSGLARLYVAPTGEVPDHPDAALCGFDLVRNMRRSERDDLTEVFVEATSLDERRWRSPVSVVTWTDVAPDWEEALELHHVATRATTTVRRIPSDRSALVVVTHDLGLAGGQLWLLDLVRTAVSSGHSRCLVVSLHDGSLRPVLEAMGVEVHVTSRPMLGSARSFEGYVHELALMIRAHGAGVVLVNTVLLFPAVLAAERADVPSLWAIHESIEPATFFEHYGRSGFYADMAEGFHPLVREQFDRSFQLPAALLFETSETEVLFGDIKGSTPTVVFGYGIDIAPIDAYRAEADREKLRAEAGFAPSDVVVLVVGVFDPRKSIGMIVAAFDELSVVHENLQLVLIGSYPSGYAWAVERQIQRCRHPARVRILPVVSDIYRYYTMADVLLSASDLESLPRSFMEAMGFHLPIVTTDVFGVQDLIADFRSGWLVRPRDLEGLVGVLHSVLRTPRHEWADVARTARAAVERRNGDGSYGEFFAHALDRLRDNPDTDVREALTGWREQKGALA